MSKEEKQLDKSNLNVNIKTEVKFHILYVIIKNFVLKQEGTETIGIEECYRSIKNIKKIKR